MKLVRNKLYDPTAEQRFVPVLGALFAAATWHSYGQPIINQSSFVRIDDAGTR
jgi:hypothetical protein